jgi:hypothetical protein
MKKQIFIYILFLSFIPVLLTGKSNAQKSILEDSKIGINYHYGFLLPEYPFFIYLTNSAINIVELNFSKKVYGTKIWHQVYRMPDIGFSLFYSDLGNDDVFGKSIAVNPYIGFHLINTQPVTLTYRIGLGLTYVSKHFDAETNYKNLPVGSHLNLWLNSELFASIHLKDRYSINGGLGFNHLSNANLAEPNIGLNYLTFLIGGEVLLSDRAKETLIEIPDFVKKNEFSIDFGGCVKKTRRFAPETYFAGSLSFQLKRFLAYKFGPGIGVDLFYDNSIPDEMKLKGISTVKNVYQFKSGIHISQEFVVGKLSLIIQEGLYIILKDRLENYKMYNRGIVRYKFSNHWYANIAMKSNLFILDVMELGIGFYWN